MTRRLVLAMTGLVALVAVALALPMALIVDNDQRAAFVSRLEVEVMTAASIMASQPQAQWAVTAADVAQQTGARVVVVDPALQLIADSEQSALDRTFNRPEITSALAGLLSSDVRYSTTLGVDLRSVAAPVVQRETIVAAVRLSLPESDVDSLVARTRLSLAGFVVAVVIAAALVAWILANSISAPLRRVADVAAVLPEDLDARAEESEGPAEVRVVARTLNQTASRLSCIVRRQQRVAADASDHLLTLNFSESGYTGGAHPFSGQRYFVLDLDSGKHLALNALLAPNYEAELNKVGERAFRKERNLPEAASLEEAGFWFANNSFKVNTNFGVLKDSLVFNFNAYEVAPYAMAPTEFTVSYDDIKAFIPEAGLLAAVAR